MTTFQTTRNLQQQGKTMLSTQAEQLMQQYKTQFMQDCAERTPKLTAFIQEILQGRHWFFFG
jgi:hypothetical protein